MILFYSFLVLAGILLLAFLTGYRIHPPPPIFRPRQNPSSASCFTPNLTLRPITRCQPLRPRSCPSLWFFRAKPGFLARGGFSLSGFGFS